MTGFRGRGISQFRTLNIRLNVKGTRSLEVKHDLRNSLDTVVTRYADTMLAVRGLNFLSVWT